MPPRRKKQTTEPVQSQETKEFTDARNKILSITPESLALFQNSPNHSLEHLSDDPYLTDLLHLVNAVDFFNEIAPLISTCPFHTQDEIHQFLDGVHSLYELSDSIKKENLTSINYVNKFKPIWDSIRNFAVHVNINLFHEMFSTSRSTISSVLRHIVQMAHEDPRSNPIIFERFKSVASTRKRLATRLSVLMHGRKIRTVITLWDKLIETQSEVIQFFKATGLMTAEMMSTVNNCFKLMFDSALHLKNLLVIQQLAAIIDRCLAHPLKCPIPPISDDEEEIVVDPQPTSENEIGRAITDELVLEVHETTDFLRVYKNFIEEVKPTIDKGEFLTKFTTFTENSQRFESFDLCPTLFSMFYKFRKLEITAIPVMIAAEYDPSAKEIKSLYRNLQVLLHNANALSGDEIDAESSLELLYPIIEKIRQDCSEVNDPNFESQITDILSSLDSICEELQTIDDTICVSFQGDQMIRKIESKFPDIKLNSFNFHCLFYKAPTVSDKYEPLNVKPPVLNTSKNFDPIIETFQSTLKKFSIEIKIEKTADSKIRITAPDICEYLSILLDNYGFRPIQILLASPPSETVFFSCISDLQREMIINDVNDERLDSAITVISTLYYLFLLLDYVGYTDFSNCIHLIYFKTFAKIYFENDSISLMIEDLNTPFDYTQIENYSELVEDLIQNSEQNIIDQKLNHMRHMVLECIDTICYLPPEILNEYFDDLNMLVGKFTYIITELTDAISSDEFYDLLCRLQTANIPEIRDFIENCISLHNELQKCWKVIPIQTNLSSFLHGDNPSLSYKKAIFFDLIDFLKLCMKFGIIYCDIGYFEDIISEPNWPRNMTSICKDFLRTMVISHDVLFKMLTVASSGLSNCSKINETVDLINRGMFTCNSVKRLLCDLLSIKAQSLAPIDKIEFMTKYAHQLTAFLMLFNTIEVLFPHSGVTVARMLNLRNFILSYCNSLVYLTNMMDSKHEVSASIYEMCADLKRLVYPLSPNADISEEKKREIFDSYLELRLKFSYVSPQGLIQNAMNLIEKVDDNELRDKFEIALNTLNSPTISESQENIDILIDALKDRFESINNSNPSPSPSTKDMYDLSMKIYDILSTLVVYYSRIHDEEAFFIFSTTNNFTINLSSPPILSPLSPISSLCSILPHQHMFSSTNKSFKKFYKSLLNEKVKRAFETQDHLSLESEDFLFPPPFVLPLETQQNLMEFFLKEKEKIESKTIKNSMNTNNSEENLEAQQGQINNSENSDPSSTFDSNNSKSFEAEILRGEVLKLEEESERLMKTIEVLNETTKNLYEDFVSSQTEQFSQFDQFHSQELSEFRLNVRHESEMNSLMQSKALELKKKNDQLVQLNQENESLKRSNIAIQDEINRRKAMKARFDACVSTNKNSGQKKVFGTFNFSSNRNKIDGNDGSGLILGETDSPLSSSSIVGSQILNTSKIQGVAVNKLTAISEVNDLLLPKEKSNNSTIFDEDNFVPEALTSITKPIFCALKKKDSDLIKWTVKKWSDMDSAYQQMNTQENNPKLNKVDDNDDVNEN